MLLRPQSDCPSDTMALTSTKQRKELGERLQSERERLGYTQEQIASLLGVPHNPVREENELLSRFRSLSMHGKSSLFMTLDALERLAPNLRRTIRKTLRSKK